MKVYRDSAVLFFNVLVIFLAINLLFGIVYFFKDTLFPVAVVESGNPLREQYGDAVYRPHEGMSHEEIDRLIREAYTQKFEYEPYTQFRQAPFAGTYHNVSPDGFRVGADQGPWPISDRNYNVFVFGGSVVFNYGVPDDKTIASQLQRLLDARNPGKPVKVYNFGRGYYFSTQERILFEQLVMAGHVPDLALFADGPNEFFFENGLPKFTGEMAEVVAGTNTDTERSRLRNEHFDSGETLRLYLGKLPVIRAFDAVKRRLRASPESASENSAKAAGDAAKPSRPDDVSKIVARYRGNKRFIEMTAREFGFQVKFVWLPFPLYNYDVKRHLFLGQGIPNTDLASEAYPEFDRLNGLKAFGDDFIWCADIQENVDQPLYLDKVHYSTKLSAMVAGCIAENIGL